MVPKEEGQGGEKVVCFGLHCIVLVQFGTSILKGARPDRSL